ncbi:MULTISPECIES: (2Fe-2S)-binding protein [Cellulophaga]|uniref:Isoquinoline 1-oxidoreductase n=2 Tax=Cellulophaga TaxID=104264 RepID=F0RBY6_CELLC|nr:MULTISPECIES: (2Fe-2S)-binding protein [Cellulophaga]ADY29620.1 Isoquinoline 1-oxidoreductase [Cellulophaga lytica DSM 7489]AIM60624.1 oxidoreductase [Cellulophaga lytica]APU10501.1 (2Fe-2S)-binding protein [Cellulophaga lytica]EWH15335.1 Isoquinoline 1-oxidoreductase [Cellulophaga geojensis KL-A]TVZ07831.1 isoquinoline 1-oxidoreductase alpha subunit [Cellulophaga sp. RHA_52]
MTKLKINGEIHTIDVDPEMPLLWAIRDIIGFTGTKFGCGKGFCGACMVLMDGNAVNSCQLPVSAVGENELITVEGQTENLQLLQKSWAEHNVPQCGFCQSGQLITATALLNGNSNPSDEDINNAMVRNICRCGTYPRIKKAINHSVELKNKG